MNQMNHRSDAMKHKLKVALYIILFDFLFMADRVTKFFAVRFLAVKDFDLFEGLRFGLVFNRGISFGFFNSSSLFGFKVLSFFIFLVILAFSFYTFSQFRKGKSILFEVFILSGALSNFLDRFLYVGVVDFIEFYFQSWRFPSFNLADAFVFIGVVGILIRSFYETESDKFKHRDFTRIG